MFVSGKNLICSLENDQLPATSDSPLQQENDTKHQPSNCNDTLKPKSPDVPGDFYKTRNRLLDNASVQSFEETLYLGASKPVESLNSSDSCTNKKTVDAASETVDCNNQQTVESEVTKIAEEW